MRIEISIGWDDNERALFPNQHRNITLDESKPTIITGRNGSGKSLFAKTIDQLFSVLSTADEKVYIEARKFFEDIGLSWANVNIEGQYIVGEYNDDWPWLRRLSGDHSFIKLPIPFVLDIISGDEESESVYCRTEYKIHATISLDNLNINPQLTVDFSLSGSYLSRNSFPILNDEGEHEDEEEVIFAAEYFSTNPFQTLHVDSLRTFDTKKMFEDIDSDLLYAEIRKAVQSIESQISRNSEDYGSADIEYYGEELDDSTIDDIDDFEFGDEVGNLMFQLPEVRYLKEDRPLPSINEEFASAIKELVAIKSRIISILNKHSISLYDDYTDYSIFFDNHQARSALCEHFSTDDNINTGNYDDIDKWFYFIPLLWKWNYTSFDQLGMGIEHHDLNHQISGDEVNQFFKDIEDIFGPYEAWPVRNRFSNLQKNLNKLIQTQVVSKYLRKTSESLPGDADENLRFLEDLMMLCSTRSFIVNQLVEFRPILRIFEEFFSEMEGSLEQSYSKFIQKINNPKIVPSGYKNLFAMALSTADLEAVDDVVYFLDEPEISLHVSWQLRLVDFLFGLFWGKENMPYNRDKLHSSNKFFVVATHSPEIVSSSFENVTDFGSTIES